MLAYYLQMLDTPEEKVKFEQIYLKYRGLVYHVAEDILHNRQDAEDAVHNDYLRIIKNEAISLQRKQKGEAPLEDWDGLAEPSESISDYHALVDSFTRLPRTYRAVMEMKLLSGYSDGEIADRLGLSKTAVSTRISRGRRLLRDIVEREGFLLEA
ncbi:MAG: sigma-70 family RNA polymerase sigma factor [Oscillospiraceae bacterium]|nr:sigma-70 family RNA polymerase sigma factor [Oscillospiraceae bacterium]